MERKCIVTVSYDKIVVVLKNNTQSFIARFNLINVLNVCQKDFLNSNPLSITTKRIVVCLMMTVTRFDNPMVSSASYSVLLIVY